MLPATRPVIVTKNDQVLEIELNRPEVKNAVDSAMAHGVAEALDRLDEDDGMRVGILFGAGGTFCSGMDLKAFVADGIPFVEGRGFCGITHRGSRKPLIVAVEGYAVAGGFEIVLACDLVVAADTARFGIPEVRHGLIASGGGLTRLPRRVPYHVAMEIALTGEFIDAPRAAELGLVNRLAPQGQALDVARELAATIVANAPSAVEASKAIVQRAGEWSEDESWARQAEIGGDVNDSEEAREGARAFVEKRAPAWRSR